MKNRKQRGEWTRPTSKPDDSKRPLPPPNLQGGDLKLIHKEWSDKLLKRLPKKLVLEYEDSPEVDNLKLGHNKCLDQVIKAIKEME